MYCETQSMKYHLLLIVATPWVMAMEHHESVEDINSELLTSCQKLQKEIEQLQYDVEQSVLLQRKEAEQRASAEALQSIRNFITCMDYIKNIFILYCISVAVYSVTMRDKS